MPDGGFLIKFDGKEVARCYAIAFDYDDWQYTVNNTKKQKLPSVQRISIEVEHAKL